jgi:hypothetical protein
LIALAQRRKSDEPPLRFRYAARKDPPPGKQSFAFFSTDVAGGDGTSMPQCKASLPLNMARSRKHHNTAEFNADTDSRNGQRRMP